jgi:quercetin dioxygenase-like cupin family protein
MPFIDTNTLTAVEKRPGWLAKQFHSPSMTFGHWQFTRGASIHEHCHPQEEVWQILEGTLEVTIDGTTEIAGPGVVAIVPANTAHSVTALSDGRAIVVDYPIRCDIGKHIL